MALNNVLNDVSVCRVADILAEDVVYPHPRGRKCIADYQFFKFLAESVLYTRYRARDGAPAFQGFCLYSADVLLKHRKRYT